ncbi:MAG: tetratricopeptide repeat protein [Bacteroidota bacterium]
MNPESKNPDDLDYLSRLGFEAVPVPDSDLAELRAKVRSRVFSYGSGFYFSWISLIIGVFIGISAFFMMYQPEPDRIRFTPAFSIKDTLADKSTPAEVTVILDTIVVKENFVRKNYVTKQAMDTEPTADAPAQDSVIVLQSRDIDLALALGQPVKEEKIRFIINAPVFYLHDLKVTNYSSLYFKRNQFVRLGGTPAGYANGTEATQSAGLKESPEYFLHNEIAQAMLHFKKGRYDQCINTLNIVSTYNPDDINCDFYLGMCFYYKKNYKKAIEYLDLCLVNQNNTFLQEAAYYKALSLYGSGDREQSIILLKQIAGEGEFYAAKATLFLKAENE